jgi:GDPmannose 4,6-dehydratase
MPTALITGISGQDGSYLAELLLSKGYRVVGTALDKLSGQHNPDLERIEIVETDSRDQHIVHDLLQSYRPDEVYNLAARASSRDLWTHPALTGDINGLNAARILEGISEFDRNIRFVQACSSEVFGNATESPQTEATPFRPRNPYGVAKAYAHWTTIIYREHRKLFACSSILYNHESPRRGLEFVTRKISRAAARISLGEQQELRVSNLNAQRDWGFAGDYVKAMWLMLQHPEPDDYIVASGESHSVRDFCEVAFSHVGLDYKEFVIEDTIDCRPAESGLLVGDASRARRVLNWKPTVGFRDLVHMMVGSDLEQIKNSRMKNQISTSSNV